MRSEGAGSLASLRELNRRRLVDELRRLGLASRAELARRTGLSRSTVSSLVTDLQSDGLVVEREIDGAGPQGGRPPVLLSLERSAGAALGLDFGKRHIRVIVTDLAHAVLADLERPIDTEHAAAEGLEAAAELVDQALIEANVERGHVIGAGMGLPGPIDSQTGEVGSSAILPGWIGVRPQQAMQELLAIPVRVENDANLGALAELTWGAGQATEDFFYVKLASGIGGGVVVNGQLYRGAGGIAGEIGHSLVDERGPVCRCGNRGCLESVASTRAIVDLLRPAHGDDLTIEQVIAHAHAGDLASRRVIGDAARALGVVLAHVCNIMNPAKVVVGGDLGAAGDVLLDPLRDQVARHAVPPAAGRVEIVPGVLGRRAEVLGAAALVLRDVEGFALAPAGDTGNRKIV